MTGPEKSVKKSVKKDPPKPTGYIIRPLWVTLRQTIKSTIHRPNTVMYPWEKLELPDGFRGRPGLIFDRCIGCGICVRICPNRCLELVEVEIDGNKVKRPQLDLGRCAMCGYCAEYCPTNAMIVTPEYELATTDRKALILDPMQLAYEYRPGFEVHIHEVPRSELEKGPEAKDIHELGLKDIPELDDKSCIGCGRCQKVCPVGCIEMVEVGVNKKGKPIKRPRFEYSKCVSCENCVLVCPKNALRMKEVL